MLDHKVNVLFWGESLFLNEYRAGAVCTLLDAKLVMLSDENVSRKTLQQYEDILLDVPVTQYNQPDCLLCHTIAATVQPATEERCMSPASATQDSTGPKPESLETDERTQAAHSGNQENCQETGNKLVIVK